MITCGKWFWLCFGVFLSGTWAHECAQSNTADLESRIEALEAIVRDTLVERRDNSPENPINVIEGRPLVIFCSSGAELNLSSCEACAQVAHHHIDAPHRNRQQLRCGSDACDLQKHLLTYPCAKSIIAKSSDMNLLDHSDPVCRRPNQKSCRPVHCGATGVELAQLKQVPGRCGWNVTGYSRACPRRH